MVFWSDKMVIQPEACGGAEEPDDVEPCRLVRSGPSVHGRVGNLSAGCRSATPLAWERCRGVETLHGLWTKYMWISQHCTTAKKMTRVYLLGTRTNSFVSAVLSARKWLILPCFLMFYSRLLLSYFLFFLLMASGHASNNPFQVVYFCFPIKFTIYPDLKIVFSQ